MGIILDSRATTPVGTIVLFKARLARPEANPAEAQNSSILNAAMLCWTPSWVPALRRHRTAKPNIAAQGRYGHN